MKKNTFKYVLSILLGVIVIGCIILYVYIKQKNLKEESELLQIANNIVNETIVSGVQENCTEEQIFSEYQISEDKTIIGKIIIPKISVEAPIKEGTSAEVLKKSVGHFSSTKYWNGNICLASHNRGTYAHYFENINKLGPNDEIMYQTKLGTRVYVVESIKEISEHDFSVLNDTGENCITLITCVKNKSDKRLCLKAIEKA